MLTAAPLVEESLNIKRLFLLDHVEEDMKVDPADAPYAPGRP